MFEFRQDTAVIQGAFLSAQRQVQLATQVPDCGLCKLSEKELKIITELVTGAVNLAKRGSWSTKWESPDTLLADMRAHATVFYTVLRSVGITCNAAENYYSALSGIFPVMDWSVYVALLKSCQWCEFFLECVNDIPSEVVACILKSILDQIRDKREDGDYYILSIVLKAILQKLLNFKRASIHKQLQEARPKFRFPFVYVPSYSLFPVKEETVPPSADDDACEDMGGLETTNETSKPLTFPDLLDAALMFTTEEMNKDYVLKVFLHGLWTVLAISAKVGLKDFVQKFSRVEPLVHGVMNLMLPKTCTELITLVSSKFSTSSVKKDLVLNYVSWDVDITYLAFLICGGWSELSYRLKSYGGLNQDSAIFKMGKIAETLFELLPWHKKDTSEEKHFTEALTFIADNRLIGMNYALLIFIQDPYLLEKEEVIACLERNTPAKEILSYTLLKAIMEKSVSRKNQLVPIFFHSIKDASVTDQQQILQYFLSKYGLSETLRQQNFSKQMSPILNQTVNVEQAEKQIILLCLQSPKECVVRIIHQAVNGNSGQIPVLAKMLKVMSGVCAFRVSQKASLLVSQLEPFFSTTTLIPQQLKNVKLMIEELLQVLGDDDGLKPSEFLISCIFPCISSELLRVQMDFLLEIVEIVFSSSLLAKRISWLSDLNIPAFVMCMGRIINLSIAEMNGSLKEKVVSVLNLLSDLQQLEEEEKACAPVYKVLDPWIARHLSSVNPVVQSYIWKFIKKYTSPAFAATDVSSTSLVMVWLRSCIYEEKLTTQLKEWILSSCNSNYETVLAVNLAQILPHLTLQEWLHSSVLLEECLEFLSLNTQDFVQHDLTDRNRRLPLSVGIFVDALILLRACTNVSLDWSYMVSNFTKVINYQINNQKQELDPKTFVTLFLELCRLASRLDEEHLKVVTVLLLDLFKILKEMPHDTANDSKDIFHCSYAAAGVMPDCVTRSNFLDSLKAF